MTDCRHCRRPTELFLCTLCGKELGALLSDLPWLLDELETTVVRQDRLGTATVGKSSDNPSPINVGAMELARNIKGQLGTIMRDLCEVRGALPPPKTWTASLIAEWLGANISAICCSEDAGQIYDEIRKGTDAILVAINRNSRTYIGPCFTAVAHNPAGEPIECGQDLYCDRESLQDVQCTRCKVWVNPRDQMLAVFKRKDLFTEAELLPKMDRLEEPVSRRRFYDWVKSGLIKARGGRGSRSNPLLYSLKEVRHLRWRESQDAA